MNMDKYYKKRTNRREKILRRKIRKEGREGGEGGREERRTIKKMKRRFLLMPWVPKG
jgi:hypothetical protein